jgi:hypothetical protein
VPGNYDGSVLDDVINVTDERAVRMLHTLTRREGTLRRRLRGDGRRGRGGLREVPAEGGSSPERRRDPERHRTQLRFQALQPRVAEEPEPSRPE